MKKLTVSLRYAAKASDVICDENSLNESLTQINLDEWMFNTDGEDDEFDTEESLKLFLEMAGVPEEEYEIENA